MARLEGLEPPTKGLENPCSIQLSYRRDNRVANNFARISNRGALAITSRSTPEGLRQETPRLNTKAGNNVRAAGVENKTTPSGLKEIESGRRFGKTSAIGSRVS